MAVPIGFCITAEPSRPMAGIDIMLEVLDLCLRSPEGPHRRGQEFRSALLGPGGGAD